MSPQDAKRVKDLRAALKRAGADDLLALDECALIWGVSKPRFVTVRNQIAAFPDARPAPKGLGLQPNAIVYPARAALEAMLEYAQRHETAAKAKVARTDAMLGRRRGADDAVTMHTPNELATINRTMIEIENREREQGLYIPLAEVQAVAADVFSEISDFVGGFTNKLDPHGVLAPDLRKRMDEIGREAQLSFHRRMRDMLGGDAVAEGNRDTSRRTRRAPARR